RPEGFVPRRQLFTPTRRVDHQISRWAEHQVSIGPRIAWRIVPTQVHAVIQEHGERIARGLEWLGRMPDRSGGAGVSGRMQQVYLRFIMGLVENRRTAIDLTDQTRSDLPGDVTVRAAPVHIPTGQRLGHGAPPSRDGPSSYIQTYQKK